MYSLGIVSLGRKCLKWGVAQTDFPENYKFHEAFFRKPVIVIHTVVEYLDKKSYGVLFV